MPIESVNNHIPYTTPDQTKISPNSTGETAVNTTGGTDNAKVNTENTKGKEKDIKSAVDQANQQIRNKKTRCEFKFYDDINRVAIKIIDRDTDEVIREIPPEKTLEMVEKMWEIAGLIIDEKR